MFLEILFANNIQFNDNETGWKHSQDQISSIHY